ncbi:hypothetical protein ACJW30_07G157700 [Castanea mollissima]
MTKPSSFLLCKHNYFNRFFCEALKHGSSQTQIFGPQTQNTKLKTQIFLFSKKPTRNLKSKPLATSDSKLSNPNGINLRPAKTESTSDSLLSSSSCLPGVWI